ncbi:MAG: isoaspartyl peptidase/L-asparaginase [Chloroflexi bacterium]|nr:isoaspartyl peptidase/L-asparaginase [Chloroflexota bacterium]
METQKSLGTIVVHGGVGAPLSWQDGCQEAVEAARSVLQRTGEALGAVVEAVCRMEDDGRFNAGSGASLRLDGVTVEMDAAVMDSRGKLGMVMAVSDVKNPVLVARAVADTPHVALAGQGATDFARKMGVSGSHPASGFALERWRWWMGALKRRRPGEIPEVWRTFDLERCWNFPTRYGDVIQSVDTVGAVVRGPDGAFAVAASTGGASPMLRGRVGDVPLIGCGFYAGHQGAVAVTGVGEEIIRSMLARAMYDRLAAGADPQTACEEGVALFPPEVAVGAIAVSPRGHGIAANREMACAESAL